MTRKKFIKMLMWAGMSRNDAADCATLVQDAERPYYWVLGDLLNFHRQDFGNPLAWKKIRYTIIHGYNTPVCRFYREIDEVHELKDDRVAAAIEAGTAAKPGRVITLTTSTSPDALLKGFDWPPRPQPAAGCLYAIDPAPVEEPMGQWPKVNVSVSGTDKLLDALRQTIDQLDTLRYAIHSGGAEL